MSIFDAIAIFGHAGSMDATEDIKQRLDIVDLIGEYLALKPAGAGAFKALCPFHQERTPSFHVSRNRQSWHCFGCDVGGDHFSFVMKMEGMEFVEALELLAQKTGVTLPQFDAERTSLRKRLYEVNDLAARFFRSALINLPQAEGARRYVVERQIDGLTADLFRIGYAPEGWTHLVEALSAKGVTEEEMLAAGLVLRREQGSGVYDRFRDRFMFPITDVHGHIVGFTGRILVEDKTQSKYVNTPETMLYRKSSVLYGLDKAKGEMRQKDLAIIVEGNMDVVSSHRVNVLNVVAASGTALTVEQLHLLKRFTTNLAIAFDQDAAGKAATLRGLDLSRAQDFSIKIITLPPEAGKDPDDAIRQDPELWKKAIADAISIMEWVYRQAFKAHPGQSPEEKKIIAREVLTEIQHIADPVERDHWIKRLARDLAVGEGALREVMGKQQATRITHHASRITELGARIARGDALTTGREMEKRLLALLLSHVELLPLALNVDGWRAEEFREPDLGGLYVTLALAYTEHKPADGSTTFREPSIQPPATLTPEQRGLFDHLALFAEREFQGQALDVLKRELKMSVNTLRSLHKARERRRLEQAMREAERVGDHQKIAELTREFSLL